MTQIHHFKSIGAILTFCALNLVSCSDKKDSPDLPKEDLITLNFTRTGETESQTPLESAEVYLFQSDKLVKTVNANSPEDKGITFTSFGNGAVYAVSGISLKMANQDINILDFSKLTSPSIEKQPDIFFSGFSPIDEVVNQSGCMTVNLERGVARIDLINEDDPNIIVNEIRIENAPSSTYIFRQENKLETESISLTYSFQEPFKGKKENVFTLYESSKPINIRIRGSYEDIPMDMTTTLPEVDRNKIYTLRVVNVGSAVDASFTVSDWQEGETTEAGTDTSKGILLDPDYSKFPEGVKVDYSNNLIIVPSTGAEEMVLAFKEDTEIKLSSTDGLTNSANVTENPIVTLQDGYLSSLTVSVAPQTKGRLGYSMFLHLKNSLLSNSYDFVEIKVEPSPYQIETVEIGGHEWMCFNATSSDLEQQIYILDGLDSVEEMYKQRFAECVGNYFQYGRRNPYSPWTSNDASANPLPTDTEERKAYIPWTNPENMPLPEGYHVASFNEWEDLIPTGTTIPSDYTCRTGEHIRATVVTLPGTLSTPSANVNKQNFKMRYVLFESLDTGNKLFIPICSNKSNSNSEVPGHGGFRFENRVTYWVANDRCVWLIDWKDVDGTDGAQLSESKWHYDGFCPVRGIKD